MLFCLLLGTFCSFCRNSSVTHSYPLTLPCTPPCFHICTPTCIRVRRSTACCKFCIRAQTGPYHSHYSTDILEMQALFVGHHKCKINDTEVLYLLRKQFVCFKVCLAKLLLGNLEEKFQWEDYPRCFVEEADEECISPRAIRRCFFVSIRKNRKYRDKRLKIREQI